MLKFLISGQFQAFLLIPLTHFLNDRELPNKPTNKTVYLFICFISGIIIILIFYPHVRLIKLSHLHQLKILAAAALLLWARLHLPPCPPPIDPVSRSLSGLRTNLAPHDRGYSLTRPTVSQIPPAHSPQDFFPDFTPSQDPLLRVLSWAWNLLSKK